jgi:hypothetical protein
MMTRDFSEYQHCVRKMMLMVGISDRKPKSIREALRDNSFYDTIREATHCRLMDHWPLREQKIFLESLSGMSEIEKRVRIYDMAYELHKADRYAIGSV